MILYNKFLENIISKNDINIDDFKQYIANGIDLNTLRYHNNETLLFKSVKNNSYNETKYLLENGLNPDIRDIHNSTIIYYAAIYGYIDIINLLIEYNADVIKIKLGWDKKLFDVVDSNILLQFKQKYPKTYKKYEELIKISEFNI